MEPGPGNSQCGSVKDSACGQVRKQAMRAAALCVQKRPIHGEVPILVSPWRWRLAQRLNIREEQ